MTLFADVWDGDYDTPTKIARLPSICRPWAEWENPGGIIRFGLTARLPGYGAYQAYSSWEGKRLIVHDGFCDRPIMDGTIINPSLGTGLIDFVMAGPWWRLYDEYELDVPTTGDNSDDVIKTALTNHASIISSNQDNICTTTVDCEGFTMPEGGIHVGRLIEELLEEGDGSDNPLFFWIQPGLFDSDGKPTKPVAYMEAQSASASVDWQVWARNKVRGSKVMVRDIGDLATSVTALYRREDYKHDSEQGVLTYEDADRDLKDTGQDFTDWETSDGESLYKVEITNDDDTECRAYLGAVVGGTGNQQIYCYTDRERSERGFRGADPNGKTPISYKVYKVYPIYATATATNNTSKYWERQRIISGRGGTGAMAGHMRNVELAKLSEPQLRHSFTIGAREICDGSGGKWPLWRMLISGGYVRDNEIGPDEGLFDLSMDYKRVGRIVSMRYDHASHTMAVTLNDNLTLNKTMASLGYNWRLMGQLLRQLRPFVN